MAALACDPGHRPPEQLFGVGMKRNANGGRGNGTRLKYAGRVNRSHTQ